MISKRVKMPNEIKKILVEADEDCCPVLDLGSPTESKKYDIEIEYIRINKEDQYFVYIHSVYLPEIKFIVDFKTEKNHRLITDVLYTYLESTQTGTKDK